MAEAVRNVLAAGATAVVTATIGLLMASGTALATLAQVSQLSTDYSAFVGAGGNVSVVTSAADGTLDARDCEALNQIPGVTVAGGFAKETAGRPVISPDTAVWIVSGTPTLARVFWPTMVAASSSQSSVVVGADLTSRLGLSPGSWIQVGFDGDVQSFHVGEAAPALARNPAYARAVFVPQASLTEVDSCFVEVLPAAQEDVGKVLVGWFGERVKVSPFASISGPSDADLRGRLSRYIPLAAVLIILAMFGIWVRMRRADYALYGLLGVKADGRLILTAVEYVLLVVAPSSVGAMIALTVGAQALADALVLNCVTSDLSVLALGSLLCPLVGLVALGKADVVTELKGR